MGPERQPTWSSIRAMVIAALIGLTVYLLERLAFPVRVHPDSVQYLRIALRQPVPQPFHRRWLVPFVCRTELWAWTAAQALSTAALGALAAYACPAHPWAAAWLLVVPVVFMPGLGPVLVDLPSMALAYASALTVDRPWLCVPLALLSGACRESGPVYASVYSLNPLPLLGLLTVRWWGGAKAQSPYHGQRYDRMLKLMWDQARVDWRHPSLVLSMGVLPALAVLGHGDPRPAMLACAVAFATVCIATDRARLMAWAAPALLPLAVTAPPWALGVGVALQVMMPREA